MCEKDIEDLLAKFGTTSNIRLIKRSRAKAVAFAEMDSLDGANAAVSE